MEVLYCFTESYILKLLKIATTLQFFHCICLGRTTEAAVVSHLLIQRLKFDFEICISGTFNKQGLQRVAKALDIRS